MCSAVVWACSAAGPLDEGGSLNAAATRTCGAEGAACCDKDAPCDANLGCNRGTCRSVITDMVAYANDCKRELGFTNPKAKMPYVSCFDSARPDGTRVATGRQVKIKLTRRGGAGLQTLLLNDNGPAVDGTRDVWDLVFGKGATPAEGCDNPNYLYGVCDPYYRLNVWKPDANEDIVAALHCRSMIHDQGPKPSPASAVSTEERLRAYQSAPADADPAERLRLFEQWNGSTEIVMHLTNTRTGKSCFFHAASHYFGSHIPAPDDESELGGDTVGRVWDELPVKPPYPKEDPAHHDEWLRNGTTAWRTPDAMRCVGCHDNGPFIHNPFIDSTDDENGRYLPTDRRARPYIPLGYQAQTPVEFIKTEPVPSASGGTSSQRCTSCHNLGNANGCGDWFDRAVGWSYPSAASAESRANPLLGRYMPEDHELASTSEFYAQLANHLDVMKCCCTHPTWQGCRKVPASDPSAEGTVGTDPDRSCVAPTCGARGQACCPGDACNHGGLACAAGTCKFVDEVPREP